MLVALAGHDQRARRFLVNRSSSTPPGPSARCRRTYPVGPRSLDRLHWGSSTSTARRTNSGRLNASAFYVGYTGWGAEQLEGEIAEGSWHVVPAADHDLFSETPTASGLSVR